MFFQSMRREIPVFFVKRSEIGLKRLCRFWFLAITV